VRFGRPAKKPPDNFNELMKLWERGKLTTKEFVRQTELKESTLYRRLRERQAKREK